MTKNQITTILTEIGGYPTDAIINVEEITVITTAVDSYIYPEETTHLHFDTTYELIELWNVNDNGTQTLTDVFSFECISVITLHSPSHIKTPYVLRRDV